MSVPETPQSKTAMPLAEHKLRLLMQRGSEFLGSTTAIMGGAMTWVSEANLVSAISNAGGFGVLACGSMPPDILALEIDKTRAKTNKPFGVNLIVMHPQIDALAAVCVEKGISHVVLAGGVPTSKTVSDLKDGGCRVVAFAPALVLARKLIRMGADALIIEGMEAGGHTGAVSTTVLAQEILPNVQDVPVFVAGGIGHGGAILAYLEMGAAGVQLGTRFVCSHESIAHTNFKQAFLRAEARDAVLSMQLDARFPVIPVRALANEGTKAFMDKQREVIQKVDNGQLDAKEAQLEIEHYWAGALRRAVIDGDTEFGSVMSGQSVGMVKSEQSVAEILAELVSQATESLEKRSAL